MVSSLPSSEALRALIAQIPVILFAMDSDGVITITEGGALHDIGRYPGDWVGRRAAELYRDRPEILAAMARALAGEAVALTVSLRGRIYDVRYVPNRAADGTISGITGLSIDVHARVLAEEAYRGLFEGASEGIFRLAPDGQALLVNPAMARLLGYERPAELLAQAPDFAIRLAANPSQHRELVALIHEQGAVSGYEVEVRRHDGELIWLVLNAHVVRDADGQTIRIEGRAEDITARKRAEMALAASEERFRLLIEGVQDYAIYMLDPEGHVASWNAGAARLKGYAAGEIIGRSFEQFYPPEEVTNGTPARLLREAAQTGRAQGEGWRVRRDGSRFWAHIVLTALRDERGVLRGFGKVTRDITELRATEAALRTSEAHFRGAFDHAAIGMALVAPDGRFLLVNHALCHLLGYTQEELLATTFHALTHPDDLASDVAQISALLEGRVNGYQMEKRYIRRDGRVIWTELSVSLVRALDGTPLHFLSQVQDIDARKLAEEQLRHQALHDTLTDLPNRALFFDRLGGALARRSRHEERLGVCFIDLDGFKRVNDRLGHAAGDTLLATIAERLRQVVRAGDTVARFGGDEFTVLLEGVIADTDAERLATRLIAAIEAPVTVDEQVAHVSASIGIALSLPVGDSAESLLAAADAAMYAAKLAGTGRWVMAQRDAPSS
jgi:diguanylate cyclase (GGDEF)-like protein/PAS domain S-box-containing protein